MKNNSSNGIRALLTFPGFSVIELENFMGSALDVPSVNLGELKKTTDNQSYQVVKNNVYKVTFSILSTSAAAKVLKLIALSAGRFGKHAVRAQVGQLVVTDLYSMHTDTYVDGIITDITPGIPYGSDTMGDTKVTMTFSNKI